MRKITIVFLVVLTSVLFAACSGTQPQINPETTSFDFGDVVNGVIEEKDLLIWNSGESDLVVEHVSTTCGCTTAKLDIMTIPAGKSANLHIEFDSGAHGPDLTGEIMRQVIIVSNDPKQPEVSVEFVANIVAPEKP